MKDLKAKLLGSSAWLTIEYFTSQFLRLASNVILSRILFPEAFGIMALVQVFLQGLEMMSDMGVRGAIIKSDDREEIAFLDTAWTVQVFRGLILFVLILPIAPLYAKSFDEPQLLNLILATAVINIINSLRPTKGVIAGIAMKHKLLVCIRLTAGIAGTITTIVFAMLTHSIWSFIFGALAGNVLRVGLLYILVPGRNNRFHFDRKSFNDILGFSMWVFVSSAATFGVNQADKIIVGNLLGVKTLGLYNVAFFIASAPRLLFESINSRIGQPLFSKKSNISPHRIRRFQCLSIGGTSAVLMLMSITGPLIIQFLYDERYLMSAHMTPFIALSLVPSILTASYSIALLARGYSRSITIYMLAKFFIQLPLMYILISKYHILGMILTLPLVELLTYPLLIYYSKKNVQTNMKFDALLLTIWAIGAALVVQYNSAHIKQLTYQDPISTHHVESNK